MGYPPLFDRKVAPLFCVKGYTLPLVKVEKLSAYRQEASAVIRGAESLLSLPSKKAVLSDGFKGTTRGFALKLYCSNVLLAKPCENAFGIFGVT